MVIVDEDIKHDVDDPVNQSPPVHGDGVLPLLWQLKMMTMIVMIMMMMIIVLQVCEGGKLKFRKPDKVAPGYPKGGRGASPTS